LDVCISVSGAWTFTNVNVTCWKSHNKVSKYHAWPHELSVTTLHLELKLWNSFLIARRWFLLVKSRPVLHHCVVIFFWSLGIMECGVKMEFCSCARGRQWCGIIHYHWWTASIKPRLLFSRAGYASWGLSLSSVCSLLNEPIWVLPCLWLSWPCSDPSLKYFPYMLYWINIRGGGKPVHTFFCFRAQCTHWQHQPDADSRFRPFAQSWPTAPA